MEQIFSFSSDLELVYQVSFALERIFYMLLPLKRGYHVFLALERVNCSPFPSLSLPPGPNSSRLQGVALFLTCSPLCPSRFYFLARK